MTKSLIRWAAASAALIGAVACNSTDLAVQNPNSGDSERVLGTPNDAEALIGTYYKRWSTGVYGSTTDLQGMASMMSLMNYSSLANNGLNTKTPFTGGANVNTPGNVVRRRAVPPLLVHGRGEPRREHVSDAYPGGSQPRLAGARGARQGVRRVPARHFHWLRRPDARLGRGRHHRAVGRGSGQAGWVQGGGRFRVCGVRPGHRPDESQRHGRPGLSASHDVDSFPHVMDQGQLRAAHPVVPRADSRQHGADPD